MSRDTFCQPPAVLKWHGGKHKLARWIVPLMPPHEVYNEPFLGGGSILMAKPEAVHEFVCDVNDDLIHFWRTLRDDRRLRQNLSTIPYCPPIFTMSLEWPHSDPLQRAMRFMVRNRMSRGGLGKTFAWSERLRGGKPGDVNGWDNAIAALPAAAYRLRMVGITCLPASYTIDQHDSTATLHYLDPPYLPETRTARAAYDHEMSRADHVDLLDQIRAVDGMVMLSGYRSDLYDRALEGWERREHTLPNHAGQGRVKQSRTECLWSNPACVAAREAGR